MAMWHVRVAYFRKCHTSNPISPHSIPHVTCWLCLMSNLRNVLVTMTILEVKGHFYRFQSTLFANCSSSMPEYRTIYIPCEPKVVHLLCFKCHWTVGTKYGHMYLFIQGQLIVNVNRDHIITAYTLIPNK